MTTKPNRLLKDLTKWAVVPLVSASSTMLERALSTVLNLLNRLDDEHADPAPEVFGCRACGLIYDPSVYRHSGQDGTRRNETARPWNFCPECGEQGVELLGPLPHSVENADGFFLIAEDGESQGPYPSESGASDALWDWFNRRQHAKEEGSKETSREGQVIRLVKGGSQESLPEEGRSEE